jgi:hypothetical protein
MTSLEAQSPMDFVFVKTAEDMPVLPRQRTPAEIATFIQEQAEVLSVLQRRAHVSLDNRRRR